jgi:hypothetical protein
MPAIIKQGTTLGATKENNPCDASLNSVGVWFIITGTGGPMVASSQTDSWKRHSFVDNNRPVQQSCVRKFE